MPDPATTIGLGVLVGAGYVAKDTVTRLLGPTADYLGAELAQFTDRRMKTVGRIFENAAEKVSNRLEDPGAVPPRVLRDIVNDASYNEDAISVEYFGGVLASSRSPFSRDDRAAVFTALLSRLSTYQIRSHYVFYSAMRQVFKGTKENVTSVQGRSRLAVCIPLQSYFNLMLLSENEAKDITSILEHITFGLEKESLIQNFEYFGPYDIEASQLTFPGLEFTPSVLGCELFLRAHGMLFRTVRDIFDSDLSLEMKGSRLNMGVDDAFARTKVTKNKE